MGEGARVGALMVLDGIADEVVEDLTLSNFFLVTIQYDVQSYQGVQSRPMDGFHSWNSVGETEVFFNHSCTDMIRVSLTAVKLAYGVASLSFVCDVMPFGAIFGRIRIKLKERCARACSQPGEQRGRQKKSPHIK